MPIKPGKSSKALSAIIKEMMGTGRSQKQAVAAARSTARKPAAPTPLPTIKGMVSMMAVKTKAKPKAKKK